VAELADAPDLGLRDRRFRNIAFRFKKRVFYETKTAFLRKICMTAIDEQNVARSSTQDGRDRNFA
jgi:hypothetical protein